MAYQCKGCGRDHLKIPRECLGCGRDPEDVGFRDIGVGQSSGGNQASFWHANIGKILTLTVVLAVVRGFLYMEYSSGGPEIAGAIFGTFVAAFLLSSFIVFLLAKLRN